MNAVLIAVSILLIAFIVAALGGFIDRRMFVGLANSCARMASVCLSVFKGQSRNIKVKSDDEADSENDFEPDVSNDFKIEQDLVLYAPLNLDVLNCRVTKSEMKEGDAVYDAFAVEICGSIHAPNDTSHATLNISIQDITNGSQAEQVLDSNIQVNSQGQTDVPEFKFFAELGRLPRQVTRLEDWTAVARFRADRPIYPRRGKRTLRFKTSVLEADGGSQLAEAQCSFIYDNLMPGYRDMQENTERTRVLTVALAFAVSAADDKLYDCEIELIKEWARENVLDSTESRSNQSRAKLEKALNKTIAFFTEGNKLDVIGLCDEIVEIAPLGLRHEILDLCLRVAKAKGSVTAEEMAMVKGLADLLEVDAAKFRTMVEKIMPIEMHKVMGIEEILGITSDMSSENTRRHLNKEYSKWNSRVTSTNPDIQCKADQMLKLIAEARGQYVTDVTPCRIGSTQE